MWMNFLWSHTSTVSNIRCLVWFLALTHFYTPSLSPPLQPPLQTRVKFCWHSLRGFGWYLCASSRERKPNPALNLPSSCLRIAGWRFLTMFLCCCLFSRDSGGSGRRKSGKILFTLSVFTHLLNSIKLSEVPFLKALNIPKPFKRICIILHFQLLLVQKIPV